MKFSPALFVAAALLPAVGFLFAASCTARAPYDGRCENDEQCGPNASPVSRTAAGSLCQFPGICWCPFGTVRCCSNEPWPGVCADSCPAGGECQDGPEPECTSDEECPQPVDPVCGHGSCVDGTCELEVTVGALPSQRYGDCVRRDCDVRGAVVDVVDGSDFFDDGEPCTQDYCDGAMRRNEPFPDAFPCPGMQEGYCYKAACVECVGNMPATTCGGGNLACDGFWCVPFPACSGACGGMCAPCPVGSPCGSDDDCVSRNCDDGTCNLATCDDGSKNGPETDVDCGSSCGPCPDGQGCKAPSDCVSHVCKYGTCAAPTCLDVEQNGTETGIDCGNKACGDCK